MYVYNFLSSSCFLFSSFIVVDYYYFANYSLCTSRMLKNHNKKIVSFCTFLRRNKLRKVIGGSSCVFIVPSCVNFFLIYQLFHSLIFHFVWATLPFSNSVCVVKKRCIWHRPVTSNNEKWRRKIIFGFITKSFFIFIQMWVYWVYRKTNKRIFNRYFFYYRLDYLNSHTHMWKMHWQKI